MPNPPVNLASHTVSLLRNRPRSVTLEQVAEGAQVKKSWLSALLAGDFDDPSANRIQRLYEYLAEKPLLPIEKN